MVTGPTGRNTCTSVLNNAVQEQSEPQASEAASEDEVGILLMVMAGVDTPVVKMRRARNLFRKRNRRTKPPLPTTIRKPIQSELLW